MGPRPFPMKETLKEYLQELKDRAVLDEKEREDAYKIEMADKIKFDVDAEEEPEEKEDGARKMELKTLRKMLRLTTKRRRMMTRRRKQKRKKIRKTSDTCHSEQKEVLVKKITSNHYYNNYISM